VTEHPRRSVPSADLNMHYEAGWAYVMPDFDRPDHYVIEWLSDKPPVYPYRVQPTSNEENAHERAKHRA
jgi:hypothetical protein